VKAALDAGTYELGVKIPDVEMERLNLRPHRTLPHWNYTLRPHEKYTLFCGDSLAARIHDAPCHVTGDV